MKRPSSKVGFVKGRAAKAAAESASSEAMMRLVRPNARDRFSTVTARGLTPDYVQRLLLQALQDNGLRAQIELFTLMEETWPMLAKCCGELKRAVQRAGWQVVPFALPGKEPSPEAVRRADLLKVSLRTWAPQPHVLDESGWDMCLHDLTDAWARGISVLEVMWRSVPDAHGLGPAILPRATAWLQPGYYAFRDSAQNGSELRLYRRLGQGGDGEAFTDLPGKFLIASHRASTGLFANTALLRPLAALWIGSSFAQDWVLNLAQLFGIPFRWVTYEPSATTQQREGILQMLAMMGSAGYAAFPAGTELKLAELTKATGDSPQAWIIDFADRMCQMLLLGQTLTSSEGQHGTQALGTVHSQVRGDVLAAVAAWLAETLNYQLVPAICQANFGDQSELPELQCNVEPPPDPKAAVDRDKVLWEMGLEFPESYLRERHGVPAPQKGEAVVAKSAMQPAPGALPAAPAVSARVAARATPAEEDATTRLIDTALEDATGAESRWLADLRPLFMRLVALAEDGTATEADFVQALESARDRMPELMAHVNVADLQRILGNLMATAAINGAVASAMRHKSAKLIKAAAEGGAA